MTRPVLYVLAGVNGAGKSSIGGHLLERDGLTWFNPDAFARELKAATAFDQETANAQAWQEGMRRLDDAIARGLNHAFETTLGGRTVTARLLEATESHDVLIWFCGLSSPELHIARVRQRVAAGGHAIAEEKIRERYPLAQINLIKLMPHAAYIKVYDNSAEAAADGTVPDPLLVLEMENGRVISPAPEDLKALQGVPQWTKSILEAALRSGADVRMS
ncbi:MAG TPA: AAA family ATPase [Steroidobacteraceae bacterium]|nr:AAA family ATPase [Steroidobacteraceae bacterium]